MVTQREKAEKFQALHERSGAFVLPNPWDPGTARLLEGLGFEALATTSAGLAQALGRLDGRIGLEDCLAHCRALAAVTRLPFTVDLENGYADRPEGVAEAIRRVAEAGAAGASIEDYDGSGIYELEFAVDRIRAAVEAAAALDFPFTLTARAENLLRGIEDLDDTVKRLCAYAEAGAHVVYAPGIASLDDLRHVAAAVPRPVNVLAPCIPGATVAELADAGARRISVGSALADASASTLIHAAREMQEQGSFDWLRLASASSDIQRLLGRPLPD